MRMKKIFIPLILFIIVISATVITASASSVDVSMTTDYESLKVGDTFDIVISVNNINVVSGIVLFEGTLHFDSKCFELVEWNINVPKGWENELNDMSFVKEESGNKYFTCAYVYDGNELGHGIVENNELFATITFKVLSEEANGKEFLLNEVSLMSDNMEELKGLNNSLILNLQGKPVVSQGEDVSSTSSVPAVNTSSNGTEVNKGISSNDSMVSADNTTGGNIWKIGIAVAAVALLTAVAFFINKRISNRK